MIDQINNFFYEILNNPSAVMVYFWLVTALILLLLEMTTPGLFFFVAFAFGALCAALAAFFDVTISWQMWISLFCGVICFFILKYLFLTKRIAQIDLKTNADGLIGLEGIVLDTISLSQPGVVKVKSELWGAVLQEGSSLYKGTSVKVVGIQGNKLIVRGS